MADRSVKITVGANVAPLKSAMADGAKSVEGLATTSSTLGSKIKSGLAMAGLTGGVLSLGAAIKGTFSLGLSFTEQLNTLQAVTGATGAQMADVSAKARQLGNDVEIPATSASDAAEAMTELAKGGLSVSQAMEAAKGTLQLAAAAQVSGAQAAEIQANALNTFGLKASDAGKVADVLANTANAASGEITDFAQAFQQAGSVAKLFGISIDDTATALGLFANNGVKGSDAGTSLKSMLTQLATPSKNAQAAMDELNLTVYDAQGQFVGMRSLTEQLAKAQGSMTQAAFQSAAGILFGSDAIRAASILASSGVTAYDDFKASVDRVGGAADLANAKMKGLPGALQQVENSLQDVALGLYDKLAPAVEKVVRGFSDAVSVAGPIVVDVFGGVLSVTGKLASAFNSLPGPVKQFGLALAGLAIANQIGLLGKLSSAFTGVKGALSGFGSAWSRVGDDAALAGVSKMRVGLGLVGSAAKSAGSSVMAAFGGPWAVALAAAPLAIDLITKALHRAVPEAHDFTDAIDENTGALKSNWAQSIANTLASDGTIDKLNEIGVSTADYTAALMGNDDAYRRVSAAAMAHTGFEKIGGEVLNQLYADRQKYTEEINHAAQAQQAATEIEKQAADATKDHSASLVDFADQSKASRATIADAIPDVSKYTDSWQRMDLQLITTTNDVAAANDPITAMSAELKNNAQATDDANTQLQFFSMTIDQLTGRNVSMEEATKQLNDQIRSITGAFKDIAKETKGHTSALVADTGAINTATQAGSDLYDKVTGFRQAYDAATDAAYRNATANGKSAPEALKAAQTAAEAARDAFVKQATAMGLTTTQAQHLADHYGILDKTKISDKMFTVSTVDEATQVINRLKLAQIPDKTFRVTAEVSQVTGEKIFITGSGSKGMARGGWIPGAAGGEWITGGTPGQDSVLRWLMPGEAVIPTVSAQANRPIVDSLIAGKPIVMPQSDNGAVVAEVRALRAETARLMSVVAASSAQNAATVVGGFQGQSRRERRSSRAKGL